MYFPPPNYINHVYNRIVPGHEHTVERIICTENKLSYIEDGALEKFISLKKLDLGHNDLIGLNENIFTATLGI